MQWLFDESIEKKGQHVGGAFDVIRQSCVAVHDRYVPGDGLSIRAKSHVISCLETCGVKNVEPK